jgi:2-haloacid dehalogenase
MNQGVTRECNPSFFAHRAPNMSQRPDAFVFDAYGTLFDVHAVTALADALAPGRGAALSAAWRAKQLEYSWLNALMAGPRRRRDDFAAVTEAALDYAIDALSLSVDGAGRARLIDAYRTLAPFPDALPALEALRGRPRWILSNGTHAMLDPLVRSSPLAGEIDGVMSVDEVDAYKPSARVYQLACDRLRLAPAAIGFVSSNGWDAAGATVFGFRTFWVNRAGSAVDRHAPPPDHQVATLRDVVALAG